MTDGGVLRHRGGYATLSFQKCSFYNRWYMGVWLRRLGVLAVLGFPMAVLGTRLGLFDFRFGFQIVTWTVYLSVAVFVIGLALSYFSSRTRLTRKTTLNTGKPESSTFVCKTLMLRGLRNGSLQRGAKNEWKNHVIIIPKKNRIA